MINCKICGKPLNDAFPHRKCKVDEMDETTKPTVLRAVSTGRYVACLYCQVLMAKECPNCPRCGVKRV